MAIRTRALTILAFLLAALSFYAIGFTTGIFFLVIVGGFFEVLFMSKLFRKRR